MTLFRAFATVGGLTMASRVLGFVRDILIAAFLGTGMVADAFFVAFKLPNFFRRLFAEGAFNAGFVPLFTRVLEQAGRASAQRFAEQALSVLTVTLLVFVTLFQIAMPWLMMGLAPGFMDNQEKFELAVTLTRLTFPYLLFISLVSLMGGILNALNRFAAVAATPILLNLCLIAALLWLGDRFETYGHALSYGVSIAGMVQFLWLIWACRRAGIRLRFPRPRLSPKVKELLRLVLPAALGAGVVQINLLIDIFLATLLPDGSVSYLFYADRLNQLPVGVVGVAVGTALLPMLARAVTRGAESEAVTTLNRAIELGLLLSLPAAAALIVVPSELISALFQRGEFDHRSVQAASFALTAYAVGLPAYVLVKVLGPAYFARHDTRTPVKIAALAMIVNVVLNVILMQFLLHAGLALATAISAWLTVGLLAAGLHKRGHFVADSRLIRRLIGALAATAVMALALLALAHGTAPQFAGGEEQRILAVLILVAGGMASYGVAAFLFRAVRPSELRAALGRSDETAPPG